MRSYSCSRFIPVVAFTFLFTGTADAGLVPPGGLFPKPGYSFPGCEVTAPETSDFSSTLRPGWQNASPTVQKMLITSDSQAFRVKTADGNSEQFNADRWRRVTHGLADVLRAERAGGYYVPLIINGDITEFGHGGERRAFRQFITRTLTVQPGTPGGPLFFPGLGNHDYANNVNDCANNGCARDAVCDHIIWTRAIERNAHRFNFDYSYASGRHRGSLSYSFDVGKVHVVQLNNEPTYTRYFETGGQLGAVGSKRRFEITASLDWLRKDLADAKARGQYTIINMHKPNSWQDDAVYQTQFKQLLEGNRVIAVFAGHYHRSLGKQHYPAFGNVPVFLSGAIMHDTYLRLNFDWRKHELQVSWHEGRQHKGQYTYNIDTLRVVP
jgi:hypothetical protein